MRHFFFSSSHAIVYQAEKFQVINYLMKIKALHYSVHTDANKAKLGRGGGHTGPRGGNRQKKLIFPGLPFFDFQNLH